MADPIVNFFSSTLVGTYSDTDTSLTIATGSGELLPDPSVDGEFNLVIYNESAIGVVTTYDGGSTDTRQDLAGTNPEIVRVTARSGDVLTVTRGQEGTTASDKEAGNTYRVILSATKKIFDDIQTAIDNVNVTDLTGVESLVFDTTGDEEFGLPAGTTAQRPASPSQGYMRYNTSDGIGVEVYNGSRWVSLGAGFAQLALEVAELSVTANDAVAQELAPFEVEYLVIAGGGGGGSDRAGGGGAGGYRSSVSGESSGGGASAESVFEPVRNTSYTVTVGAGGSGGVYAWNNGSNGSTSIFNTITTVGGGGGGNNNNDNPTAGNSGGSGGGGAGHDNKSGAGGAGTTNQGFAGGNGLSSNLAGAGGGGGGASQAGANGASLNGGDGGDGVASSITGSSVTRAGGGGGGIDYRNGNLAGSGGAGGGGAGGGDGNVSASESGEDATTSTGSGGGGCSIRSTTVRGGNGGSGVVILRYPSSISISIGAGLTASTATVGANKVTTFTAGTDTISFS